MGIRQKIWSYPLVRTLAYVALTSMVLFLVATLFLRWYTQHGQKLILQDFVGMNIQEAKTIAQKNGFQLLISDSVHIVGKPGGEVLAQNPRPGSPVKEGRKIYLTLAKYNADRFLSSQLPELYGKKYDLKVKELSTIFKLDCKVIGYAYDPGPAEHILEVQYQGKPIENKKGKNRNVRIARGDELEFILSKREGGKTEVPDLKCQTLESARFITASNNLSIDRVEKIGSITDESTAIVVSQDPSADGRMISMGSAITVTISQEKPTDCP